MTLYLIFIHIFQKKWGGRGHFIILIHQDTRNGNTWSTFSGKGLILRMRNSNIHVGGLDGQGWESSKFFWYGLSLVAYFGDSFACFNQNNYPSSYVADCWFNIGTVKVGVATIKKWSGNAYSFWKWYGVCRTSRTFYAAYEPDTIKPRGRSRHVNV
jgi:hypothetical protein